MRAVWCILVVLCLLGPLGTAGITIAHADAETELTTPRSAVELPAGHKRVLDLATVVPASIAPRAVVQVHEISAPIESPALRPRLIAPAVRSRAPPV